MNLKKLQYVNEFLIEQMNHWLFFPLALRFSGVQALPMDFRILQFLFLWMLLGLFPLVFFVLRTKLKSLFYLLLLQIAAAVPIVLAGTFFFLSDLYLSSLAQIICTITAIVYILHSMFLFVKFREPLTRQMPFPAGVAVVVVAMQGTDRAEWVNCYIFPMILCIGLYFVTMYIQRYIEFLKVNSSSAGTLPAEEMLHSGLGLAAGYTVFGTVVLLILSSGSWLGRFTAFLKDTFAKFTRWLKAWVKEWLRERLAMSSDADIRDKDSAPDKELPRFLQKMELNETSWLWRVLEYVFWIILLLVLLTALVVLIRGLIRYLQKIVLLRIHLPMIGDEEAFDIREKCDEGGRERKRPKRFGPLSYGDRIRRLYKKKLLSCTGQMTPQDSGRLGIYTAREWEDKLSTQGMADIYERARYTGQEMTAEDLSKMRESCRM